MSDNLQVQQLCATSRNRLYNCTINLLNENLVVVSKLDSEVISGSVTIKNNVDSGFSRRSGQLTMNISKDLSTDYFKISLKNKVQIVMTITNPILNISADYPLGMYILSNPTITATNENNNTITVDILDLMSDYDGTLSGALTNKVTIPVDSNIPQVINSIARDSTLMNISKTLIESNSLLVPSNLEISAGGVITDIFKGLMDFYMNFDLYFNDQGYLVYEQIKNRSTDTVLQTFINSDMIISYDNYKKDFTNFRNQIFVSGTVIATSDTVTTPYQITAVSKLEGLNNPLSVDNLGIYQAVVTNDKAQTVEMAQSQADYELSKRSSYCETISLNILPDYRLLPNRVIILEETNRSDFKIPNSRWIINQIQANLDGSSMTLELSRLHS